MAANLIYPAVAGPYICFGDNWICGDCCICICEYYICFGGNLIRGVAVFVFVNEIFALEKKPGIG